MNPVLVWLLFVIAFLYWKRKNIERHGIIFMLKNKGLATKLYNFSSRHLKRINPLFDLGVIVGFIGMFYAIKLLFEGAVDIFKGFLFGEATTAHVSVIIPGVAVPGSPLFLPLLEGIIAIAVLAIVHEFSHAIAASIQGMKPKAVALVLLAFIPAAGVELDEKKVSHLRPRARLRIFAAGSFANFLTAGTFMMLAVVLTLLFVTPTGIEVLRVENGTAADGILTNGTVITAINGVQAIDSKELVMSTTGFFNPVTTISFSRIASQLSPGDKVILETSEGEVEVTLGAFPDNPTRGRIGIITSPKIEFVDVGDWLPWLLGLIHWIIILNLGVGLINLLPAPLFDGGRMAQDLISVVFPKGAATATRALFAFALTLLVVNLLPTLIAIVTGLISAIVGMI